MARFSAKLRGILTAWPTASRRPAFGIFALAIGIALIFAGQILAQDDHDDGAAHAEAPQEHAADDSHGADDGHGNGDAEGHGDQGVEHPPHLVTLLAGLLEGEAVHEAAHANHPVARFLLKFQAPIFSLIVILILFSGARAATRNMTLVPGKFQNFVEWVVEALAGLVTGVIGPEGIRFVPYIGTLFLYIYFMNIMGLFPFGFGATSMLETTAALALTTFVYVQYTGIRSHGPLGYLYHLAGEPKSILEWCLVPLLFPLHVVGEIAKPISLSLRLFGNILGGETLLVVFIGLGVSMLAFTNLPIGIPLQLPFIFLELLVTFVQALVFTLLTTIYFSLVLPHPETH